MEKCNYQDYLNKAQEASKYYGKTHRTICLEMYDALAGNDYRRIDELYAKLPTVEQIFEEFIERLDGKSVYTTLKKMNSNDKSVTEVMKMKCMSSLLTHACIEIESGNEKCKRILPILYERIGNLVYKVM